MDKLSKISFALVAIFTVCGLGFAIAVQAELFVPGQQFFTSSKAANTYHFLLKQHALFLSVSLPLALICGTMSAVFLRRDKFRNKTLAKALTILGLLASVLAPFLLEGPIAPGVYSVFLTGLFFLCLLMFKITKSGSVLIYTLFSLCPIPVLWSISVFLNVAELVSDTYVMVAYFHALGLILLNLSFALGSVWVDRNWGYLRSQPSIIHAILMNVAGYLMIVTQQILGFRGQPRQYFDYPDAFAFGQFFASLAGFTLTALIFIGIIRFVIVAYKKDGISVQADVF